ncbi:MAG: DegT/DnrJ/EryC1/StrS family aminotransferase, partial [Candidatus Aminicenantes bacterium]|nr:DegT/DnrJ/EryC1/StrS family aminotransferase [Candidatus Aminicenantes bacterium]
TSALHLALLALEVKEGDEIIIPSFVCTAVLNAVNYTRAIPRIVDIDPLSFNISVPSVEKAITKQTKAVIVPHMFGSPAEMGKLMDLGVPVIEDCAQSIGANVKGRQTGSFGLLSVFSFYGTKVLTSGEGGMVLSDSNELVSKLKDLRDYDNKQNYVLRYNYKMTDLQAALGLNQLLRLDDFIQKRQKIASKYFEEFRKEPISLPHKQENSDHIYFRFVVKTKEPVSALLEKLHLMKVFCQRPVFSPLHVSLNLPDCPNSAEAWEKTFSIPLYPSLTDEEIERIIGAVKDVFS